MNKLILIFTMLILSSTITFATKPYYLLNMMKVSSEDKAKIQSYETVLREMAKTYKGELLLPRLNTEEQLVYDNSPENIVPFDFTYFFILKFDSKKAAKKLLTNQKFLTGETYFKNHTIVLSKTMKGLPSIPEFPIIQESDVKPAPSFVLFNPFSMKKSPFAMIRMLKYFRLVTPKVSEAGTKFYSAFRPKKVAKGSFKFDMLFLTVWESMDAFNGIHYSDFFTEHVPLRNKSLKRLGEAKGVIE